MAGALLAETVNVRGYAGDEIIAYYARPLGAGPYPGVVVLHHAPGWDEWNKSVARRLALHGYAAILPNLHFRAGPGSVEDMAATVRASGGVPDTQCIGDVDGAIDVLRSTPYASGKVGVMGFCSGGRQTYLVACNNPAIDAAVDCWGGRVVAGPEQLTPNQPVAPLDMTADLACPLLALFGEDDPSPSPADAARTEEELKKHNKVYEFHMYKNAGHGFFSVDRPNYRQHAAVDGWRQVFKCSICTCDNFRQRLEVLACARISFRRRRCPAAPAARTVGSPCSRQTSASTTPITLPMNMPCSLIS